MQLKGKSFLKLLDFTPEEINGLIELAKDLKDKKKKGIPHRLCEGKNIALIFEKTSKLKIQKIETILSDCNENEIAFITKIVETSKEFFEKESK